MSVYVYQILGGLLVVFLAVVVSWSLKNRLLRKEKYGRKVAKYLVRSLSTSCESTGNTGSYPEVAEKAPSVSRNADTTELDKDVSSLTISQNLPPEFFRFTQDEIIERFNDQRENYQFAVVLLTPHKLTSIRKTKIQPLVHKELNQDRYTDSKHPFFPPGSEVFSNYIVARPHEGKHAEEILLENFAVLWMKFNEYYAKVVEENCGKPRYIILYSWLMPCSTCVKAIIDTLSHYKSARVIIAYTLDWVCEQNNERNRAVLKNEGITVQKVPYNKFLQPKKPPITTQPQPTWHDHQRTNFPHLPRTHSTTFLPQYPVQQPQLNRWMSLQQQNSHNVVASATHNPV